MEDKMVRQKFAPARVPKMCVDTDENERKKFQLLSEGRRNKGCDAS